MKKIELGQAVSIFANLGVVVGVLLLVYELNQNRQMMQAQTRSNIAQGVSGLLFNLGSDPELSSLWARGSAGEELDFEESNQFFNLLTGALRYFEDVHYQYRNGLYDEVEFQGQKEQWRVLFSQKGYIDYWCERRIVFSPEFTEEIDGFVASTVC